MDLSILSGPMIGALIGYGTNWIAIKMLFRPLKPVKIGKFTLPFTPGIIPKRKNELAKAIGDMVGNNLFTKDDIQKILLSNDVEKSIVGNIIKVFENQEPMHDLLLNIIDEEDYAQGKEALKLIISDKIRDGLIKAKLSEIIVEEGKKAIKSKVTGMLKMFVTDDLINSIVEPMGFEVEKYIKEHSQEKVIPIVENEISELENKSILELIKDLDLDLDVEKIRNEMIKIYENFVLKYVSLLLEKFDISKVVEEKINDMNVIELEKLILTVMKKELGAIVNLGALIGLILGTVNIFI